MLIIMTEHQQGWTVDPRCQCKMPNVKDRIIGQGIRFDNGYTPNALCAPARASFFSGLYPTGHGMYNNYHSIPVMHSGLFPEVTLFSENLKQSGYNLSFIGKWHVSAEKCPADYGWEGPDAGTGNLWGAPSPGRRDRTLNQQSFDYLKKAGIVKRNGWPDFALYGTRQGKPEDMTDFKRGTMAIQEIKRLSQESNPWVIYVGLTDIHDPYIVTEPYASMYNPDDIPIPPNYYDLMEDKPSIYRRMRQQLWSQLSERQVREAIAYYWGLCSMNDDVVGMLLDSLDEIGVSDNTMVLYTSDHGDQVGGHGLFLKGVLPFEESYHIPMAVRFPEMIKPSSVSSEFVNLCDFAPTFCDLSGSEPMPQSHGRSLVPIFEGKPPDDWTKTFFGQFLGTEYYYTQRIIRDQRYKYVFNGFDFDELYDLQEDPYEIKNLANNSDYDNVKKHLLKEMWRWCEKTDDIMFNSYPSVALVPFGPMI
jgi:arylsulfatase A-like enzyme